MLRSALLNCARARCSYDAPLFVDVIKTVTNIDENMNELPGEPDEVKERVFIGRVRFNC